MTNSLIEMAMVVGTVVVMHELNRWLGIPMETFMLVGIVHLVLHQSKGE